MRKRTKRWPGLAVEFLMIFVAVVSAFALQNWNENRREHRATEKILTEISKGLEQDVADLNVNIAGHKVGIAACQYWRRWLRDQPVAADSANMYYLVLTRDFISVQNISGYETLKARGQELVTDDSLRHDIIQMYEYHYTSLRKIEESYFETQYQQNYYPALSRTISPYLVFNEAGSISGLHQTPKLTNDEKQLLLSHLLKIEWNRGFTLDMYQEVLQATAALQDRLRRAAD